MKKFIFAGLAALAVLGLQQSAARAQHGCASCPRGHGGHGHGGHGHHCVRAAHVPVEFPLPCLTIPIPKLKVWCACPPCSWGAESAWYNAWPGAPVGRGYAASASSVPYYWNGR